MPQTVRLGVRLLILSLLFAVSPLAAVAQPTVTLTVNDDSAAEAGQDPGSFTVTRTNDGNTGASLSVWVTLSGTATVSNDYTFNNLGFRAVPNHYSVTINAGDLSKTVTVTPERDNQAEGVEIFVVALEAPGDPGNDYTIGNPSGGQITISDDVAEVTLTMNDTDAAEAGQDPGSFTVTRSSNGNTGASLNVWLTLTGSATVSNDYTFDNLGFRAVPNIYSVTINGGAMSKTVTVTPVFDQTIEGDETFIVTIRQPGDAGNDYTIGSPSMGTITIRDFVQTIFKDSFETE